MNLRITSVFAAVLLLAACTSQPDESADTGGSGDANASQGGQTVSQADQGPEPGSQSDLVVNVGDRVFFALDQYNLNGEAQATLSKQAAWMSTYPAVRVTVEGHCDERGTREYNLGLGERRANAIKDFLVASGIAANRVTTISYGKERPVAMGHNEEAWSQNRRGVTSVAGAGS